MPRAAEKSALGIQITEVGVLKNDSVFKSVAAHLIEKINSDNFIDRAKRSLNDFSRKRKLGCRDYILALLKCNKRSLQSGLNAFCKEALDGNIEYSKQAFSKGRNRILPTAIKELFEDTVVKFYNTAKYKKLKGYRVLAIDGTDYNLPYNEQLMEEFGSEDFTRNIIKVQALGSCLYDVLNNFLVDVRIDRFNGNERVIAKAHIEKLVQFRTEKDLILFDRRYPSENLIAFLEDNNIKYLMRCTKNNFFKEVKEFKGTDGFIMRSLKNEKNKDTCFVLQK